MSTSPGPKRCAADEAATEHPEITYIGCARCGTLISRPRRALRLFGLRLGQRMDRGLPAAARRPRTRRLIPASLPHARLVGFRDRCALRPSPLDRTPERGERQRTPSDHPAAARPRRRAHHVRPARRRDRPRVAGRDRRPARVQSAPRGRRGGAPRPRRSGGLCERLRGPAGRPGRRRARGRPPLDRPDRRAQRPRAARGVRLEGGRGGDPGSAGGARIAALRRPVGAPRGSGDGPCRPTISCTPAAAATARSARPWPYSTSTPTATPWWACRRRAPTS